MGNGCRKGRRQSSSSYIEDPVQLRVLDTQGGPQEQPDGPSQVVGWEVRQKELNGRVLEKMREDFKYRPDNFVLNLLAVSVQFYSNYSREKSDVIHHIRDREVTLSHKLSTSKRKIIYQGGFEEISGRHVLFQPQKEQFMELPTPLQIHVVQDNLEIYPEYQFDELQKRNYSDVDGPAYRFCTEYSVRHKGYVRLRAADIIPGVSRHNTYEDIYNYMNPTAEDEQDPVVDKRPLRQPPPPPPSLYDRSPSDHRITESEFEDTDEEDIAGTPLSPTPTRLRTEGPRLDHQNVTRDVLEGQQVPSESPDAQQDGVPRRSSFDERRPTGICPTVGPGMESLKLSSNYRPFSDDTDGMKTLLQKLSKLDEDNEEEEEDANEGSSTKVKREYVQPTEPLDKPVEVTEREKEVPQELVLSSRLNTGCFVNRKLKIQENKDAYGLAAKSERRTYLSSERYLECFEDDFPDLAKILGKEHLIDDSKMQVPAVLADELMVEQVGPKFHTEFIPTVVLKEWPLCAFQWRLRERKTCRDPETDKVYSWPEQDLIKEASDMGCNLLPIGYYNPKEPNTVMKIEWQIQFIKAEQILLRSLGHSKIRLLLLVEYLMRDHLGDIPGLRTQHFRNLLFWMCERNVRHWSEERLGIKLKAYFKTLYECLSIGHLPHYFINNCNMIETLPEKYLRQIQALVRRITQNLPVYLMHTMMQMRTKESFYPMLDVYQLYKLVTKKEFGVADINLELLQLTRGQPENTPKDGEDVLYSDSEEEREYQLLKEKLHEVRRKRKKEVKKKSPTESHRTTRRRSSIQLTARVENVNDLRAGKVLSLFAEHFLAMARVSNENRAYPESYMYLLLAGNMATLLEENGHPDYAKNYRSAIVDLNVASRNGIQDLLLSPGTTESDLIRPRSQRESLPAPRPPEDPSPRRQNVVPKPDDRNYTPVQNPNHTVQPTTNSPVVVDQKLESTDL